MAVPFVQTFGGHRPSIHAMPIVTKVWSTIAGYSPTTINGDLQL